MKVSVVVPVYNPGPLIEPLARSLAAQTLPAAEFEAILVDDGSTDETPQRLARLAAEQPNVRVIPQENSGWPGRPRNVGTDAARGEYVFYCDHDDWFEPPALQRLYEMARRHDSDIVIGKMAGHRRGVPRQLFRRNVGRAREPDVPLAESLTPHKLFRRDFLDRHGLRFPEGRRRLEDHVFVTRAYLLADVVSVLADEVCYHHIRRDDAGNAAFSYVSPTDYFGYVRETLDVLDELSAPEAFRAALLTRTLRTEMMMRLEGRLMLDHAEDYRAELFAEIRRLLLERFPVELDRRLPARQLPVVAAVRAGNPAAALRHAEWTARIAFEARLEDLCWQGEALSVAWSVRMSDPHGPLLVRRGDRLVLAPAPDIHVDLTATSAEVVARTRGREREMLLPGSVETRVDPGGALVFRGRTQFRADAAGGRSVCDGVWDLSVWVQALGWSPEFRLGARRTAAASAGCRPALLGQPGRLVRPYWTQRFDNLSVEVGAAPAAVAKTLVGGPPPAATGPTGRRVTVTLPLHVPAQRGVAVRLLPQGAAQAGVPGGASSATALRAPEIAARLAPHPHGSVLELRRPRRSPPGPAQLALLVPPASRELPLGVPLPPSTGITSRLRTAPQTLSRRLRRLNRRWSRRLRQRLRRSVRAVRRRAARFTRRRDRPR